MFRKFINTKINNKVVDKENCLIMLDHIFKLFFIGYFEEVGDEFIYIEDKTNIILKLLYQELVKICVNYQAILDTFIEDLYEVRKEISLDLIAILENDPSVKSIEEVILAYPGLRAITTYRIANLLYLKKVIIIPRILSEDAHMKTGIDIHPGATIGDYFFIDHGTGIVIGETAVIGSHVRIYQGVTIGALNLNEPLKLKGVKRHPTICDNVIIYANATLLGGETVIGKNSIIGSNVFIKESIPENHTVYNKQYDLIVRKKSE